MQKNKTVNVAKAWSSGYLEIDRFLMWKFDEMSKADQNLKISMFRKYYSYYNDGDNFRLPMKQLAKIGCEEACRTTYLVNSFHGYNKDESLEIAVVATMKYLMNKYGNTKDRKRYREWKNQ